MREKAVRKMITTVSAAEEVRVPKQANLRLSMLGAFGVELHGQSLIRNSHACTKTWSMFKYLLSNRGHAVPAETLMDAFWNDVVKDPKQALHLCIHRLRRTLTADSANGAGCSYLVIRRGTYSFNWESDYWLDVDEFEQLCQRLQNLGSLDCEPPLALYRRAIELYRGDYMVEDINEEWAAPRREALRAGYREMLLGYVDALLEVGSEQNLREACRTAAAVLPAANVHMELLQAMIGSGYAEAAKLWYQEMASTLLAEHRQLPAPALQKLYHSINERQCDHPFKSMDQTVQEPLQDDVGALICGSDVFRHLCAVEQCRSSRSEKNSWIACAYIEYRDGSLPSRAELQQCGPVVTDILQTNLRKGDAVCHWNAAQILFLLSFPDGSAVDSILQRLQTRCCQERKLAKFRLRMVCRPLTSRRVTAVMRSQPAPIGLFAQPSHLKVD